MNNELTVTRYRLHSLILVTQTISFYIESQELTYMLLYIHDYNLKCGKQ